MQFLLTERAIDDLLEIERFSVDEWGRKVANQYLESIRSGIDRLIENPELLQQEPTFGQALYFYRVKKHLLICTWQDRRIILLTVVHTSMDIPTRLQDLAPQLRDEIAILHAKLQQRLPK